MTNAAILPGIYTYKALDGSDKMEQIPGPRYFQALCAPNDDGSIETRSGSSRSSFGQDKLRTRLVGRDFKCLLSGAKWEDCVPAHIVPQSRPEITQQLIEPDGPPVDLFQTSMGILLAPILLKQYDALKWSLYHKDGTYQVHFFYNTLGSKTPRLYHGKILTRENFRTWDPTSDKELPDPRLCEWHYKQCLMARIRVYEVKGEQVFP